MLQLTCIDSDYVVVHAEAFLTVGLPCHRVGRSERGRNKQNRKIDKTQLFSKAAGQSALVGECPSIAQKGVRASDARNSQLEMAQMLQKNSVLRCRAVNG